MSRSSRPKGKARPRRYHHGHNAGRINDRALQDVEGYYDLAENDLDEVAAISEEHRDAVAEYRQARRTVKRASLAVFDPGAFAALG